MKKTRRTTSGALFAAACMALCGMSRGAETAPAATKEDAGRPACRLLSHGAQYTKNRTACKCA